MIKLENRENHFCEMDLYYVYLNIKYSNIDFFKRTLSVLLLKHAI